MEAIGNTSSTTYQSIRSNQDTLVTKQSKTLLEDLSVTIMENYRNEEVGQNPLLLEKAPVVTESHRDLPQKT